MPWTRWRRRWSLWDLACPCPTWPRQPAPWGPSSSLTPLAALVAHLPDAYIAKLQCLEPQQLAFER